MGVIFFVFVLSHWFSFIGFLSQCFRMVFISPLLVLTEGNLWLIRWYMPECFSGIAYSDKSPVLINTHNYVSRPFAALLAVIVRVLANLSEHGRWSRSF